MGLFSEIFGRSRPNGLFRSEMQHLTNKVDQIAKNQDRILEMRENGIAANERKSLQLFFTTNAEPKAERLIAELTKIGYQSDWDAPQEPNDDFIVSSLSTEMTLSEESLAEWTDLMCDLAAAQDCEFNHWQLKDAS